MFLSSFKKTQNKSNIITSSIYSTKNFLNPLIKFQIKHVSRSLQSRENREKYDLKKMEDYWESVDKDFNRRMEIAKQIEEKYETKSENLISNSNKTSGELKEIYFVPLIKSDENILNAYFKPEKHEDIRLGGRLVLLDEVKKYNKRNPLKKIEFDYEPLDYQDFEKIKKNFNYLLTNKEYFIYALQHGKKIFDFFDSFKEYKNNLHKEINNSFRRIEHLEAVEDTHPLRNNIEISLKKVESSKLVKSLLKNNKIDEKALADKFNKIYFEFLDYVNRETAYRRQFDIELFDDSSDIKKSHANTVKEIKETYNKLKEFLESVCICDELEKNAQGYYKLKNEFIDENSALFGDPENIEKSNIVTEKANKEKEDNAKTFHVQTKEEEKQKNEEEPTIKNKENINMNTDETNKSNSNSSEKSTEGQTSEEESESDSDSENESENGNKYSFEPDKDYSDVFEKNEDSLTFDELEYIRFLNDSFFKIQKEYLNLTYPGRLLFKLLKAEEQLSSALNCLEINQDSVFNTKNLIKSEEIDKIITELKSFEIKEKEQNGAKDDEVQKIKGHNILKNKIELNGEESLLRFLNKPRQFLQNLYWDIINLAKESNEFKIPENIENKDTYLLNVIMKFFADVEQSKNNIFIEKERRLDYFGEKLKAYKQFEKAENSQENSQENVDNEDLTDEEKINPETYFTPNFQRLLDFLNKKHGLVEKSVFNFKNNVESKSYKYPLNVIDLNIMLYKSDELSKEIFKFYLENSNENNTLSEKDEEKVLKYVDDYLQKILIESNKKNQSSQDDPNSLYIEPTHEEESADESDELIDLKDSKFKKSSYYSNLIEKNLFDRVQIYADKVTKENLFFKIFKSSDLNKVDSKSFSELQLGEIVETVLVKGVFHERFLNNRPEAYFLMNNQESLGLKYYMHKSLKEQNEFNEEDNYIFSFNSDQYQDFLNDEKLKLIKTRDNKIVLRIYYQISDCSKAMLINEKNEHLLDFENNKNYKHFLIFENELKSPNNLFLLTNNFDNWIAKHEIDMNNWKLVDIDNFMKGNSFFNNKTVVEADINENINSLDELDAALEGYFYDEYSGGKVTLEADDLNIEKNKIIGTTENEIKENSKNESKKASVKEKNKKDAKESKTKEKESKGKKGEKVDKSEKKEKNEMAQTQKKQRTTKLKNSYKVNYLFDLKDSEELKKYSEDYEKTMDLIDDEINKHLNFETSMKIEHNKIIEEKEEDQEEDKKEDEEEYEEVNVEELGEEYSEYFSERLMEYIKYEKYSESLNPDYLVSLMESKNISNDVKQSVEEINTKKEELLEELIEKNSTADSKKVSEILKFDISSNEINEESGSEKQKQPQIESANSNDEKVSRMIDSHLKSLFKKYDIEKINNLDRIKI